MVTTHCPGCGCVVQLDAVVCESCLEFLPQSVRRDLGSAVGNPALLPLVQVAAINALAHRPPALRESSSPKGGW